MPSRTAGGPTGSPESIRALLRSDPSVVERGFRIFDFDFRAGPAVIIDAIGADRSGRLAILAVASSDPEAALTRLLDAHLWVADQRDLLGRLYSDRGVNGDRPARGFLLAPSFSHAFLRRLSLVSVDVSPCLARDVAGGNGARLTIVEPAAAIFGLANPDRRLPEEADRRDRDPFWPDGVLTRDETESRGSLSERIPAVAESLGAAARGDELAPEGEMPWPEASGERLPWDDGEDALPPALPAEGGITEAGGNGDRDEARPLLPAGPATPGAFESLTDEEMDEFERFERQRRERGGRTS